MRPYAETIQAQAKLVGISPTNPPVIPLYTPSKPPVIPFCFNRGGLEWDIARPMDIQPARGNRGGQGIDPGFRLPPINICGHFLRKAPFHWALAKRLSGLSALLSWMWLGLTI